MALPVYWHVLCLSGLTYKTQAKFSPIRSAATDLFKMDSGFNNYEGK